jgi:hypothetical protein
MAPQRSSRFPAAALGLALSLVSARASAQGSTAATNQSAAAQARFDAGRQRFERAEWEGALEEFRASLELYRSPNTRLYIGLCLLRLDRVADAFNELTRTATRPLTSRAPTVATRPRATGRSESSPPSTPASRA